VFKKYALAATIAAAASSVAIAAQSTPAPQSGSRATVLTGCVYNEQDVPGRAPNVAERAGIAEDYILADIKPAESGDPRPTGTSGTTAGTTANAASMYKLEFVDDAKLKALVGKRVEVSGRIDAEPGDAKRPAATAPQPSTTDKVIGRDLVDLAEFEVASIKEVPGTCPAKPAAK
jgi:hypothetical protein